MRPAPIKRLWRLGFAAPLVFAIVGAAAIAAPHPFRASTAGLAGIRGVVNPHRNDLLGLPEAMNPRATVSVIGSTGTRTADTNASGEFSFGDLAPGTYRIEFKKARVSWSVDRVVVCPEMVSVVETRDPRTHSRFEGEAMGGHPSNAAPRAAHGYRRNPEGGAGIVGRIRTPDQKGIAGVRLSAERLSNHGDFTAMTDENGGYRLTDLPAGVYRVTISSPFLPPDGVAVVTVLDGLDYRLDRYVCRRSK